MVSHLARRGSLLGCFALAGTALAALPLTPADAQQVIAGKGSVTIDLGVLNQLGQPVSQGYQPNGSGYSGYGQPYAQAYPQPYAPGYLPNYGGLQFPPQQYPASTLLVQPPAGAAPYVPMAAAPAPAPTPTAASTGTAPGTDTSGTSVASTAGTTTSGTAGTDTSASGTPPPPPSPSATTVPMAPAVSATTTPETTPSATVTTGSEGTTATTSAGADTTGTASAATTAGSETNTASTSTVPSATPLATGENAPAPAAATTAAAGTDTGGAAAVPAAPAAPAAAATGTDAGAASGSATGAQTASVPPASATEGQIRIAFPADSADIPDSVKAELDALAQKMGSDQNMRIQLLAYASGTSDQASRARRMSLSRALSVRSYLIKQGVASTRMDVRALGNNVEGSPADRVDIIPKAQ